MKKSLNALQNTIGTTIQVLLKTASTSSWLYILTLTLGFVGNNKKTPSTQENFYDYTLDALCKRVRSNAK